jgi:hypothetical protein
MSKRDHPDQQIQAGEMQLIERDMEMFLDQLGLKHRGGARRQPRQLHLDIPRRD